MASDTIVPVVEVKNVKPHPNAELLCLVEVLGYQMVCGLVENPMGPLLIDFVRGKRDEKGRRVLPSPDTLPVEKEMVRFSYPYSPGDRGVYFPADTLIPREWADRFGATPYLHGPDKNRVQGCRLRGEPSFGLLVPLPPEGKNWPVGYNAAEFYDAKKYEPPPSSICGDDAPHDPETSPYFSKYTDIQNGRLLYDAFFPNEEVAYTEKIHGTNSRIGIIHGICVAGSHTRAKKMNDEKGRESVYWFPWSLPDVTNLLASLAPDHEVVILYGEIYGMQSLRYGLSKGQLGYRVFDLCLNGAFMHWPDLKALCECFKVEMVPTLAVAPFALETALFWADGSSKIPNAPHLREGVVVRPLKERTDPRIGRVILKFIGTEYDLSKHKEKDTTDV